MDLSRQEKCCCLIPREMSIVYSAFESGPGRFTKEGKRVGRSKSGGYGWRTEKSLTLGLVESGLHEIGTELEVEILGDLYKATVIEESPYDPQNEKLRA
jgi:dimethylglycine dehydrogenase